MKFCVLFLTLCCLYCHGFIFDQCTSDADCTTGCCRDSGSLLGGKRCSHYIGLHGYCHLSGRETSNCGCGPNQHCSDHIEGGSQIAIEGNLRPGYGFCEQGPKNTTSSGLIATEG